MSAIGTKTQFESSAGSSSSTLNPDESSSQHGEQNHEHAHSGPDLAHAAPINELDAHADLPKEIFENRLAHHNAEVTASTRVARQANNPDSFETMHMGDHAQVNAQNITLGGLQGPHTGSVSLDRTGVMVHGDVIAGGHALNTSAGIVTGNAYGEFSVMTENAGKITAGFLNGASVHGTGLTFTQMHTTSATNEGLFVVGNAHLNIELLEVNMAAKEAYIAFNDKKFAGLQVSAGASTGLFGGGIRLFASAEKQYILKRWMSLEAASPLLGEKNIFKPMLRSMGILSAQFERPNILDPRNRYRVSSNANSMMKIRDEVSLVRQGTITGGIAGSFGGVYLGAHGSFTAEYHMILEKNSADTIKVTVTPKANRTITGGLSVDLPLLASATAVLSRSTAQFAVFEFDLTHKDAEVAYKNILQGVMPAPIIQISPSMMHNPAAVMQNFRDIVVPPKGVRIVSLVYGERPGEIQLTGGLSGLKNIFGDRVGMLGFQIRKGESRLASATGQAGLTRAETRHESRRASLKPGDRVVSGKFVDEATEVDDGTSTQKARSMSLEASIVYERPNSSTRKDVLNWLNQTFYSRPLTIDKSEDMASLSNKYSYGLTVKRELTDANLKTLWMMGALSGNSETIESFDAAANSPLNAAVKFQLITAIKARVASQGAKEIGRLHRLLGDDKALKVEVDHKAYKEVAKKLETAKIQFLKPIDADTDKKAIIKRIDKVKKYSKRLDTISRDLRDDLLSQHFHGDDVKKRLDEIKTAKRSLTPLVEIVGLPTAAQDKVLNLLTLKEQAKMEDTIANTKK